MEKGDTQAKKKPGCFLIGFYILIGTLLILLLLAAAGALYESRARAGELESVSPPGQMVDVGGYKLHITCTGPEIEGQPTVILEAGAGGWSMHWYEFQQQVAEFARVCAYDRAGFGWSDSGPRPRDGQSAAAELHTLLTNSGEKGPYLLVGASRGGQYARIYRDAYPQEVMGMVLVDAEPEDFRSQAELGKSIAAQNQVIFSAVGWLTRLGIFRLMGGDPANAPQVPCVPFMAASLPVEEQAAYLAVEGQPKCFDALLAEETATDLREDQVRQTGLLDDLPLVVLTHGIPNAAPPGVAPELADQTEQVWQDLQEQLSRLSTRGKLVVASESGHNIAVDQPGLVLAAIRQVMEMK